MPAMYPFQVVSYKTAQYELCRHWHDENSGAPKLEVAPTGDGNTEYVVTVELTDSVLRIHHPTWFRVSLNDRNGEVYVERAHPLSRPIPETVLGINLGDIRHCKPVFTFGKYKREGEGAQSIHHFHITDPTAATHMIMQIRLSSDRTHTQVVDGETKKVPDPILDEDTYAVFETWAECLYPMTLCCHDTGLVRTLNAILPIGFHLPCPAERTDLYLKKFAEHASAEYRDKLSRYMRGIWSNDDLKYLTITDLVNMTEDALWRLTPCMTAEPAHTNAITLVEITVNAINNDLRSIGCSTDELLQIDPQNPLAILCNGEEGLTTIKLGQASAYLQEKLTIKAAKKAAQKAERARQAAIKEAKEAIKAAKAKEEQMAKAAKQRYAHEFEVLSERIANLGGWIDPKDECVIVTLPRNKFNTNQKPYRHTCYSYSEVGIRLCTIDLEKNEAIIHQDTPDNTETTNPFKAFFNTLKAFFARQQTA